MRPLHISDCTTVTVWLMGKNFNVNPVHHRILEAWIVLAGRQAISFVSRS